MKGAFELICAMLLGAVTFYILFLTVFCLLVE